MSIHFNPTTHFTTTSGPTTTSPGVSGITSALEAIALSNESAGKRLRANSDDMMNDFSSEVSTTYHCKKVRPTPLEIDSSEEDQIYEGDEGDEGDVSETEYNQFYSHKACVRLPDKEDGTRRFAIQFFNEAEQNNPTSGKAPGILLPMPEDWIDEPDLVPPISPTSLAEYLLQCEALPSE